MWTLPKAKPHVAALACVGALLLATFWIMPTPDAALVEAAIARIGPLAIVLLVALGIVISPIPSGAVALVAGAAYGTGMGGALTVAGAVLGAGGAFALSRGFGRGPVAAWDTPVARMLTRERSQTALMLAVFLTRLIPFISFDAVSYVSGLTPIRAWRFLVATCVGTTPVCFAFAHAGATARSGDMPPMILFALTVITLLVPAILLLLRVLPGRATPRPA